MSAAVEAVLLDIEGTTSGTHVVVDVLYPYSRERIPALVAQRGGEPAVASAVEHARQLMGEPPVDDDQVVTQLLSWLDADRKVTPLKSLQGIVWAEGFERGDLTSHFFPDAADAIRDWHAQGLKLFVFSSGSVAAQRSWFRYSDSGDMLPLISGWFDTESAGPKVQPDSYRSIVADTGIQRMVFLSDRVSELDAARAAGLQTILVRRPGEPPGGEPGTHRVVASFDEVKL